MNITPEGLEPVNGRPVFVRTASGRPVSMGRFRFVDEGGTLGWRLEIFFETESMSCTIGIGAKRLATILPTWDGEFYRYTLPSGERVWNDMPENVSDSAAPIPPYDRVAATEVA